jgi:uncharacterized protein (TIGR02145 family)
MKNPILRQSLLLLFCWRLRRHFVALCAIQWRLERHFGLHAAALSFFLFNSGTSHAQAPQGIPYQAIARNASGVAIANTAVKVRFSIRDSIATGAIKYQETHNPTTSALGLFSVNVGMGTVVSGTFSGINWGKNAKFLQVELDPAGGSTYTDLGTTQMMSVPYALQANSIKMKTSASGDTLYTGNENFLIIPGLSAANPPPNWNGSVLTDIEGNTYNTIQIGSQVWMKENLKVSKFRNGNTIQTGLPDNQWSSTISGAYTIYNNDPANNTNYGKLYNWYAVADSRGLCPAGWHVPTVLEFNTLVDYLGGSLVAGGKMKALSSLWTTPNTGADNSIGFTGLPGGYRFFLGGFGNIGNFGFFWSSTEKDNSGSWAQILYHSNTTTGRADYDRACGLSIRCLKD